MAGIHLQRKVAGGLASLPVQGRETTMRNAMRSQRCMKNNDTWRKCHQDFSKGCSALKTSGNN